MLSRVAENLYWISRYVERAENVARLLDDAFHLELDAGSDESRPLEMVLNILASREQFDRSGGDLERESILHFLTFDRSWDCSIRSMIQRARENARGTQETLSSEAWSQLNQFHLYLNGPRAPRRFQSSPFRFFDRIKRECTLFAGLIDDTLPRTEVYHFLQVGRQLERVDMIARIVNVHCLAYGPTFHEFYLRGGPPRRGGAAVADSPATLVHWMSLLRSCSAYEAYLKQFHEKIDPAGVVRYLVLEPTFPRAIRYCVNRCLESLRVVSGGGPGFSSEAERRLGRLDAELRYMSIDDVLAQGISPFLEHVQDVCNHVGQDIAQAYFIA